MKRTCIQCGKEFELTNSEIGFYRKRKLALPKRCKECREANRKNTGKGKEKRQTNTGNNSKDQKAGINKGTGINKKTAENKNAESANLKKQESYSGNREKAITSQETGKVTKSGKGGKKSLGLIAGIALLCVYGLATGQFTPADVLQQLQSGQENTSQVSTTADGNSKSDTEDIEYTFRSEKLFEEHYEKHGIEMGFETAEDYLDAANDVIDDPDVLHKIEAEDGDDVYFLEKTNEFVVVSGDGYIRTYFEPEDGIEYYERQ